MTNKPEIVFTFPACMGGVASFNFNIINNSSLINSFYSKVILLKEEQDNRPIFLESFVADEVIIFNDNPSLQDFAEYCQTIPYEVLTSISRRVKRIYIKD